MAGNERDVLRFAAAHRLVSGSQAAAVGGGEDGDGAMVVQWLVGAGLLSRVRLTPTVPGCLVITDAGLMELGSGLPVPVWEMRGVRRALAAAWVWVRAQDGRFPGLTGVVSQREMVSHDLELASSGGVVGVARPYGIRVGGVRPAGASERHHPDVLLEFWDGWVAVEIMLGGATPQGLGMLLTAYGTDDRYGQVIFLVERERVAVEIEKVAVSGGLATVAMVQWMEFA